MDASHRSNGQMVSPGRRSLDKKTTPPGGWFLPSYVIGRATAPLGFWPFSDANCASRFFCSLSG
jgi:hypothetical protein